jgi:cytochrome c
VRCVKPGVLGWSTVLWSAALTAQPLDGAVLYEQRCGACHSVEAHRVGPLHQGVGGRRAGALRDYDYSEALRNSKVVWTAQTLDQWLANPQALIPGQKMGYRLDDPAERGAIVRFLLSLK